MGMEVVCRRRDVLKIPGESALLLGLGAAGLWAPMHLVGLSFPASSKAFFTILTVLILIISYVPTWTFFT